MLSPPKILTFSLESPCMLYRKCHHLTSLPLSWL